ncbi:hypothetical protein D9613_002598 [Agrocybe pediades]|uniref:Uncharacterized protein n=1 Tax=Agrocybe pediades TaxID=84607 RepID=A0A8H4QQV1_9AGAR|nr:hypothetical protein D9613_002598 [Agrocybe pediades]
MTTICSPTPSFTSTSVSTSQSEFTITSILTSALPAETSTSVVTFTTCATTNSTSTCATTSSNSIITLPAGTTTITSLSTGTSEIPITNLVTLFGSSCVTSDTSSSTTPKDTSTSPPPPTNTPPPPPPPGSSNSSSILSASSSGSSTTSLPPSNTSSSNVPSDTGSGATLQHDNKNGGGGTNVGPIVGGVVGGVAALVILGLLTWRLIKKQSRFDDIFNSDRKPHYQKRSSMRIPEPKPYNYGLVGSQPTPNSLNSHLTNFTPPSSPPPTQGTFNNIGPDPFAGPSSGPAGGSYQPVPVHDVPNPHANIPNVNHLRNPSLAPLIAGVGVAAGAGTAAGVIGAQSRPSSTASTSTSPGPLVTSAVPGQSPAFLPNTASPPLNSSYPPALQNWSANQGYAGPVSAGASGSGMSYPPGPSMAIAGPSGAGSSLSHNASANSTSMYSQNTITNATTSTTPSSWGGPALVPLPVGAAAVAQSQAYQQYEDPFARTGSPVSFQENRVLQVRNATVPIRSDSMRTTTTGRGVSRDSVTGGIRESGVGIRESGIYDPNAYYLADAGSAPADAAVASSTGTTSPTAAAAGRSTSAKDEKRQLVHLDGSQYQERPPAPPVYKERDE